MSPRKSEELEAKGGLPVGAYGEANNHHDVYMCRLCFLCISLLDATGPATTHLFGERRR